MGSQGRRWLCDSVMVGVNASASASASVGYRGLNFVGSQLRRVLQSNPQCDAVFFDHRVLEIDVAIFLSGTALSYRRGC